MGAGALCGLLYEPVPRFIPAFSLAILVAIGVSLGAAKGKARDATMETVPGCGVPGGGP
jgi:hypothetical protein